MHHLAEDEAPSLEQLYGLTAKLFSDHERFTRALDWVDTVLPVFAAACRAAVLQSGDSGRAIDLWSTWLSSESSQAIEEAGKGEVFEWRIRWLRTLLDVTRRLSSEVDRDDPSNRERIAQRFWGDFQPTLACFPVAYWRALIEYLCSESVPERKRQRAKHAVIFPLILSEPVVDGGTETNVILAQFLLEADHRSSGEVYLAPEQSAVRCMDAKFADSFRDAALAAKLDLAAADLTRDANTFPGVSVRVQTVKPAHERFLSGTMLRGESGGGALAVGLRQIYDGRAYTSDHLAISFALRAHGSDHVDGKCHYVGGGDDKVRGCAKQGVTDLLVARAQQGELAMYGRMHGVQMLGATSVAEAANTATEFARPSVMPRPVVSRTSEVRSAPKSASAKKAAPLRIVILHYRRSERDRGMTRLLETHLKQAGNDVFVDRYSDVGITWAREIEERIRDADIVLPLLSAASIVSELLAGEIQSADEARQRDGSKPRIIPIRVDFSGPMPDTISHITESLPPVVWSAGTRDAEFLAALDDAIAEAPLPYAAVRETSRPYSARRLPAAAPGETGQIASSNDGSPRKVDWEPFAGLVPLNSEFYIERDTDAPFYEAVDQRHSVILVKGARQMGKSSLVARGLARAEQAGARTAFTDFQKLSMADLQSLKGFYLAVGRMLARQLKIGVALDETWADHRSPNLNFEEYFEDHVLPAVDGEIVWAMDEVDKLFFATDFSSDVFGLLRSWANERQGRASSAWAGVTMMIAYATEAHLFITDINQSPFNVGTRFEMLDFTLPQVGELNRRYGEPMTSQRELSAFFDLVGGHPFLVRRGLYAMVTEKIDVSRLGEVASADNGPLSDHLRRILTLLARNSDNIAAVKDIIAGRPCPNFESFYHLRSAGVLRGDNVQNAEIRCNLYRSYLARHLQ